MYKHWNVGFNDYWFTASIQLKKTPTGLVFLEWLAMLICDFIPQIKLPRIKFKLKNKEDLDWIENKNGWTDFRELYGDLSQLWHIFVCIPINNLTWRRTEFKQISLPFNFAQEKFPNEYINDSYFSDLTEDLIKKEAHKKTADKLDKKFKKIYNKLNYNYLRKRRN